MATLFFYVPFPRTAPVGDCRQNADEVELRGIGTALGGNTAVVAVFQGEENVHQIGQGDYLCVNAHGDTGTDTSVGNNRGNNTRLARLTAGLTTMGAQNAIACYFFICYSAEAGHIAHTWKAANPGQTVYGCDGVASGAVVKTTRSGAVMGSLFHVGNGQLSLVP